MEKEKLTPEELARLELEVEDSIRELNKIRINFIADYEFEMRAILGDELQQLLVALYFQGDEFASRQVQEYCYKILKEKNLLWYEHRGDYHNIQYLENSKYL